MVTEPTGTAELMGAETSSLLIIDVQPRLLAAMSDAEDVVATCDRLLTAASALGVPHSVTEQYSRGLGHTDERLAAMVAPEAVFEKLTFSALQQTELAARLDGLNRRQVVVAGMETHICVLQSVLELCGAGYRVFVVADAVTSRLTIDKAAALERMRRAGAEIVTSEMVVFEWMRSAAHPEFRAMSKLIK